MLIADELRAALERLAAGSGTDADWQALQRALLAGQITLATGDRALALSGGATDSVITTGDGNVVVIFKGCDADAIQQIIRKELEDIAAEEHSRALRDYFRALRDFCANFP